MEAHIEVGEVARRKRVVRKPAAEPKSYGRSKISNGRDLLPDIDCRSLVARRYRDIASAVLADQSGADQCSEARKQLIRRFAAAAVLAEQMESRLANGEEINIAEHATLSSTLVRLAQRIGIDRVSKDIGPSLGDLMRIGIEERQREAAEAEAAAKAAGEAVGESNADEAADMAADETLTSGDVVASAAPSGEEEHE